MSIPRERWEAIKALVVTPRRQAMPSGTQLRDRTRKPRRPAGIAKHLAAQHTNDPARERRLLAALSARTRRRTPISRKKPEVAS